MNAGVSSHHSHSPSINHQSNHLMPNNNNIPSSGGGSGLLNASNSTHSSNFYENTMQSDSSSLQKRKSVISSQSTGSSNEVIKPFLIFNSKNFNQNPILYLGSPIFHTTIATSYKVEFKK